MSTSSSAPKYLKEQIMRASIVLTATDILLREGSAAVTYDSVAKLARIPRSQIPHYFSSIDRLLHEGANSIVNLMLKQSEEVVLEAEKMHAEEIRERIVDLLIRTCLPDDNTVLVGYYKQMLLAEKEKPLNVVYQKRRRRLNLLIEELLSKTDIIIDACMLSIQIDGAVLQAISKGENPRESATCVVERHINDSLYCN
ncbi:TetR/AcrR family transcriptional regulator [Adlercreutzia sp. ZJ138]|uniref:TetR/AcrR family transcriptional regulator n=1 Tax=Adlercreutzia sp. ZJ138 TaxID=2709405 RepID=UPI0013ED680B|nr:hypothetical protein [Adlercreutzia sp. ZJ138]